MATTPTNTTVTLIQGYTPSSLPQLGNEQLFLANELKKIQDAIGRTNRAVQTLQESSGGGDDEPPPTPTPTAPPVVHNYLINGAMMASQENATNAVTTGNGFPVDMFAIQTEGITILANQSLIPTPAGSPARITLRVPTAKPALATTDNLFFNQRVEGMRAASLNLGTANAKTIAICLGVNAPAGTYALALRNGTFNRSYVTPFTIADEEAGLDVLRTFVIQGDTGGTWAKDATIGLDFLVVPAAGTALVAPTQDTWLDGNFITVAGSTNFAAVANQVFQIFDVGLYAGESVPDFQIPDFPTELNKCQRYFLRESGALEQSPAAGDMTVLYAFKATMRATPTIAVVAESLNNISQVSAARLSPTGASMQISATAAFGFTSFSFNVNARL